MISLKILSSTPFGLQEDVVIPEPQDAKSPITQVCIAGIIVVTVGVLASICFDDEHMFEADEIGDPGADRHLTPEFYL